MRKILYPLFLFFLSSPALHSQGICDSVVTIHPIQSACAGTEERYLSASHAGGVFSGPGVVYDNGYLNTENLTAGFYTVKYTITGPGGCTVTATRDYEVRDAEYINTWATGVIDCSDANSKVFLHAILQNPNNYFAPQWEGPTFSNYHAEGADVQTASAGLHKFYAYSATPGQCMAYGFQMVNFTHAPAAPALESCTDCSDWPLKVKSTPTIPGWKTRLIKPDGTNFGNIENCTAVWFQAPPGNYKVEMYNDQNGCRAQKAVYLDPENIRPGLSAGSDVSLLCNGTNHLLAATDPKTNGNGFSFFWTRPDGTSAPCDGWGSLFKVTEPGRYILHGINQFTGCEKNDTAYVKPTPLYVKTQFQAICEGEEYLGHTLPGKYTDTITLAGGCKSVVYTNLFVLTPVTFESTITPDHGQMQGSIQINITQGWPPYTFVWNNGATGASIFNLAAGNYTVTITDANNCMREESFIVPLSKPGRNRDDAMPAIYNCRVFPNPVAEGEVDVTVSFQADTTREASILCIDALGRQVADQGVTVMEGVTKCNFRQKLSPGIYALVLKTVGGTQEISKLLVD